MPFYNGARRRRIIWFRIKVAECRLEPAWLRPQAQRASLLLGEPCRRCLNSATRASRLSRPAAYRPGVAGGSVARERLALRALSAGTQQWRARTQQAPDVGPGATLCHIGERDLLPDAQRMEKAWRRHGEGGGSRPSRRSRSPREGRATPRSASPAPPSTFKPEASWPRIRHDAAAASRERSTLVPRRATGALSAAACPMPSVGASSPARHMTSAAWNRGIAPTDCAPTALNADPTRIHMI